MRILLAPGSRRLWVLVLVSALGTRASSLAYVSQATYERAMVADHPDDPTIVFYLARAAKQADQIGLARETLSRIPPPPWPIALVIPAFSLATELSDSNTRDMTIEYALRTQTQDPVVRAYGMRWRYQRGEVREALALARSFEANDAVCPEVRRQLEFWIRDANTEPEREQIQQAAGELRCSSP